MSIHNSSHSSGDPACPGQAQAAIKRERLENFSEHWPPLPSMGSASAPCWEASGSCWALHHHHTATKQSWDSSFPSPGQTQLQKPTFTTP